MSGKMLDLRKKEGRGGLENNEEIRNLDSTKRCTDGDKKKELLFYGLQLDNHRKIPQGNEVRSHGIIGLNGCRKDKETGLGFD